MLGFLARHIGSTSSEIKEIYKIVNNYPIENIIPKNIISKFSYRPQLNEIKALNKLKKNMDQNPNLHNMIGLEYHDTILPNVIKRSLLENPKWYTSYTPYQAEISQGRLESLFNYQTLISELTQLPISNSSLLDSGSAATEALNMAYYYHKEKKNKMFVCENVYPHIKEILNTRANVLDIELVIDNVKNIKIDDNLFGFIFSYPDNYGKLDWDIKLIRELKKNNTIVISNNDLMSLLLVKPPGELGVDISIGSTQRFGLPLWYGGPHSAFMATTNELLRYIPGRIVGETIDKNNNVCYRTVLQTREQHIKKSKATSNICTSQSLLANVSSMYAIYHGKNELKKIASDIFYKKELIKKNIQQLNYKILDDDTFDTIIINTSDVISLSNKLNKAGYNVRKLENKIGISVNEKTTVSDCYNIIEIFKVHNNCEYSKNRPIINTKIPTKLIRNDNFLNQNIFRTSKSETQMMRYINKLSEKDYSLVNGMIPLGSCTMKLNAVTELEPLSWETVQNQHPYQEDVPIGYSKLFNSLENILKDITGLDKVCFQTNSGAMGEYTGLLCIKKYHKDNDNNHNRNVCFIPASAHGTNFASAKLAKMKIVTYDENIDIKEFSELVKKYKETLACLMITYPNTYGIFNKDIKEITKIIHDNGGLVYMDGANMNAQVNITSPGECGADVCHLNLHKTFCIPHGGGGPGMGPIVVNRKLIKYLPSNIYQNNSYSNNTDTIGMITNSNYSSASLLVIPYLYLRMMGSKGLETATHIAILNANYLKKMLEPHYSIYKENEHKLVGHEFIIDLREFRDLNITEKDIAKRLIDYSFHSPTMSWPIAGTIMIEPTESEDKKELDRFISAMISIRNEIKEIEDNIYPLDNNVLVNAPHSMYDVRNWKYNYSIDKGAYPIEYLEDYKLWPTHSRINDVYGDRNIKVKLTN